MGRSWTLWKPGASERIRIDAVEVDPDDPSGEIMLHTLSVYDRESARWQPLCLPDSAGKRLGFPFAVRPEGRTHHANLYRGRRGQVHQNGLPTVADHARWPVACGSLQRMYRTWCGPTTAVMTVPPRATELSSKCTTSLASSNLTTTKVFLFEAAWGPHGAVCVAHTRIESVLTLDDLERRCPRLAARLGAECDEYYVRDYPRTLLFNKSRLRNH